MKKVKSSGREIELSEIDEKIIKLFDYFLRKWCREHDGEDAVLITDSEGKKIFVAKLLDKEDGV